MTTKAQAIAVLDQLDEAQQEAALVYLKSLLENSKSKQPAQKRDVRHLFGVLKGTTIVEDMEAARNEWDRKVWD